MDVRFPLLIVFVLLSLLEFFLSKSISKWAGLLIPATFFVLALIAIAAHIVSQVSAQWLQSDLMNYATDIFVLALYNIPTFYFSVIYYLTRKFGLKRSGGAR